MIGIYKITNKINGKSYIGQSIHCGKRFDEHLVGDQLIDQVIQIDGIENFIFEVLEECEKEKLNIREDYYIEKFNTMFPNGYNKRWNTGNNRETVLHNLMKEKIEMQEQACIEQTQKQIEEDKKATAKSIIPERYVGIYLSPKEKEEICKILDLRDGARHRLKWTSVKKFLKELGWEIRTCHPRVNGKQVSRDILIWNEE